MLFSWSAWNQTRVDRSIRRWYRRYLRIKAPDRNRYQGL